MESGAPSGHTNGSHSGRREQAHLTVEREQAQLTVFPRDGSLSWELPVGVGERRGLG